VLLGQSDVVSLSLPLSAATHHFIGKKELACTLGEFFISLSRLKSVTLGMKKGSRLINTSRGPGQSTVQYAMIDIQCPFYI